MGGRSSLERAIQGLAARQQSTAALHRQQTQALANIAAERREDRALLRELLQRPATPPTEPGTSSRQPSAETCGWPEEERNERRLNSARLVSRITALSSELADERNTGESASQLRETETSERLRLERDMKDLQTKYERAIREIEFTKKRLQQQNKRQLERRISDLQAENEESQRNIQQLKEQTQRLTAELRDTKLHLEGQQSRNHDLEKRRKSDSEPSGARQQCIPAGRPRPAPRQRVPPAPPGGTAPPAGPRNKRAEAAPRGPAYASGRPAPGGAPQTPGQECWRCGQSGHFRRECPLMEVGQRVGVAGPPASSHGPGETYHIPTDASNSGLGAVLSQEVEGTDRPVLYISRKLVQREKSYSTVEKECLAIRWAVGALRYYLLGRPFTLWSDHAPLQWLHRMKDANARITRWYLALQPFNFKVIHRPGTRMVVADFLSRSAEGGGGLAAGGIPA
ncbi:uncharacterized protein [Paralichthys olivaceus]|uniref:uncharacterized protein n=1 Tax=Paralichthys olivaceus TaxID=8255 RepID=UPI00375201B7